MDEEQLTSVLNQQLADFFGKLTRHLDDQLTEFRQEVRADVERLQNTADGIADSVSNDEAEQAALGNQLDELDRRVTALESKPA